MILEKVYDELMAQIEDLKKAIAGGSGGSIDYDRLDNRPKVNNITLTGNKKSSDLKIAYSMTEAEYAAATKNAESIYCLQENATTFEEEDESASSYIEWSAGDPSGYVATWVYAPSNQNFTGCTAVECDDAAITVEGFVVAEGEVQVFLSCDDTTQIGETVTFTYTLTQPAGSTRIMKNGLQIGGYHETILYDDPDATAITGDLVLPESMAHFDAIGISVKGGGYNAYNVYSVADLLADVTYTDRRWFVGTDSKFWFFYVKDATTLAKTPDNNNMQPYRIIGITY